MTNVSPNHSPYAPPRTEAEDDGLRQPIDRRKLLWRGFFLAPPVAPLLSAAFVFVSGMLFHDPNDTGTPIGIVAIPVVLLTFGILFAYFLMLIIGMPIIFWLERHGKLNFYSINAWALFVAFVFAGIVLGLALRNADTSDMTVIDLLPPFAIGTFGFGIFFVSTASVFWLVVRKSYRQENSAEQETT